MACVLLGFLGPKRADTKIGAHSELTITCTGSNMSTARAGG